MAINRGYIGPRFPKIKGTLAIVPKTTIIVWVYIGSPLFWESTKCDHMRV